MNVVIFWLSRHDIYNGGVGSISLQKHILPFPRKPISLPTPCPAESITHTETMHDNLDAELKTCNRCNYDTHIDHTRGFSNIGSEQGHIRIDQQIRMKTYCVVMAIAVGHREDGMHLFRESQTKG